MLRYVSVVADFLLIAYLLWQVISFVPGYRRLKQGVAHGEAAARIRFYSRALLFQYVLALLAIVGLGFSKARLTTASLRIGDTALGLWLSSQANGIRSAIVGIIAGVLVITIVSITLRRRGRQVTPAPPVAALISWWRRVSPDFLALIPTTGQERTLFAVLAFSSGICEEIVFRGWFLFVLHEYFSLNGTSLIAAAAIIFGLAHLYQGVLGILATAIAGAFFCLIYLGTGTLLIPILLHILVNMRALLLRATAPAPSVT
jgi:membrane protease YdiL (CAAX protease family)